MNVVVVGSGVIGSTVAHALMNKGVNVRILDPRKSDDGSSPSGGHMITARWFKGMAPDDYKPALKVLEDTWGLHHEKVWLCDKQGWYKETEDMLRLDTEEVIQFANDYSENYEVTNVRYRNVNKPVVTYKDKLGFLEEEADYVVVCVGHWADKLMPELFRNNPIKRKRGVSFYFRGHLDQPFIQPWEPYKQIVAHRQSDNMFWAGDGSAILDKNWTQERTQSCLRRCMEASGAKPKDLLETRTGIRAYCNLKKKSDVCLILKPSPRVWVATGAQKCGTIAGGLVANRVLETVS